MVKQLTRDAPWAKELADVPMEELLFHGSAHEFQAGDLVEPDRFTEPEVGPYTYFGDAVPFVRSFALSRTPRNRSPLVTGRVFLIIPTGEYEADPTHGPEYPAVWGNAWRSKYPLKILREIKAMRTCPSCALLQDMLWLVHDDWFCPCWCHRLDPDLP